MKLSEAKIRESFKDGELLSGLPIFVSDVTDSTMQDAKKHKKPPTRAIFLADEQTAGKGRLGRKFISDGGVGLYMTLIYTPTGDVSDTVGITAYAAVVTRRAIYELTGIDPSIKWVNDIVKDGRKIAGILTEGIIDPDTGTLSRCLVGIGVNVSGRITAPEICDIATTLETLGGQVTREALAARITEIFYSELHKLESHAYSDEYRRHSSVIGKNVNVIRIDRTYPARVLDITDSCELVLSLEDGTREILATGEVSVREKKSRIEINP